MKKLLLCSAAVCGLALGSAPAHAQFDITVGGHSKTYVGYLDQDNRSGLSIEERDIDILRESELHINAEATSDNGLTYGVHLELEVDGADDSNTTEESYVYLSGGWGRVNIGSEDGASYLLQVAAPSADSNIDGLRQYINPVAYSLLESEVAALGTNVGGEAGIDYDNDLSEFEEKITYLSPVWNGFQFGLSYTPELGEDFANTSGLVGFNDDDDADDYGEVYEAAVRYEGQFNNVGFAIGAGWAEADLEEDSGAGLDDHQEWNIGIDLDIGPFGVGAIYTENNNGVDDADDDETYVIGVDYTTGPFKLGASAYFREDEDTTARTVANTGEIETDRYTGGVIYTAAPGLTFRGSISYIEHEISGSSSGDPEATSVMGGVQINF